MSYDSRTLELLATQFIRGNTNKENLEQMISQAKCQGTDYIVDSRTTPEVKTEKYRTENQGDRLVVIKNDDEVVAVLEYYFDSPGVLYLPWGESYEKGKRHMSSLFSEAKTLAKSKKAKIILCEIDDINEKMQEIAYHWGFKQGGPVQNSNNTNSSYCFYDLN